MERELKQRVDNEVKTQIMDGLLELNPIDIPASLVKEEIDRQKEQMMQQMPNDADASFLGDELFSEQAQRRVRLGLVVGEIVQKSEIKADAAAVRAQVAQQVIDYYYSNPEMLRNVEGLVLEEAVTAKVLDASTVTEETRSFQDMMNPPKADSVDE